MSLAHSSTVAPLTRSSVLNITSAKGMLAKPVYARYVSSATGNVPEHKTFTTLKELLTWIEADCTFMDEVEAVELREWSDVAVRSILTKDIDYTMKKTMESYYAHGGKVVRTWEFSDTEFTFECTEYGCNGEAVGYYFDGAGMKQYLCDSCDNAYANIGRDKDITYFNH